MPVYPGAQRSRECVSCHADTRCSTQAACAILCRLRDGLEYKFWVYILSSRTGTLYTGITGFFTSRILQHKYDSIEGFTRKYQCHRLVYYERHQDVLVAIGREKQIKRWRRDKKIALIEKMNLRWQDLAENWGREMRFWGQPLGRTP
jgi:putative endonuclease